MDGERVGLDLESGCRRRAAEWREIETRLRRRIGEQRRVGDVAAVRRAGLDPLPNELDLPDAHGRRPDGHHAAVGAAMRVRRDDDLLVEQAAVGLILHDASQAVVLGVEIGRQRADETGVRLAGGQDEIAGQRGGAGDMTSAHRARRREHGAVELGEAAARNRGCGRALVARDEYGRGDCPGNDRSNRDAASVHEVKYAAG